MNDLRAFYLRAKGTAAKGPAIFETSNPDQYYRATVELFRVKGHFNDAGIQSTASGSNRSGKYKITTLVAANGEQFSVKLNLTRPQAVTETSREAYRTIDFTTSQGAVLNAIYGATLNGLDITRAEIAALLQMEKSSVSGRVNELMKMSEAQPFKINGKYYRLSETDKRLSSLPDATVKNEAFRLVECAPYNFKPAAETAAQQSLFV